MLSVGLCAVVIALQGSSPAAATEKPKTGPHGGIVVALGTYTGEVSGWESYLELFVYDSAGKPIFPKRVTGTVRMSRPEFGVQAPKGYTFRARRLHADLVPKPDGLRADIGLLGLVSAELRFEVEVDGRPQHGIVVWRREHDRSRLGDWE